MQQRVRRERCLQALHLQWWFRLAHVLPALAGCIDKSCPQAFICFSVAMNRGMQPQGLICNQVEASGLTCTLAIWAISVSQHLPCCIASSCKNNHCLMQPCHSCESASQSDVVHDQHVHQRNPT
jgi:hypothetical protein